MNRRAPLLAALALLSGCSLFGAPDVDVQIQERATPVICSATTERPDVIDLKDTPPTLVMNTETGVWGYWFDSELYAALAENLQAMKQYMTQSREIREKLVECIEDHNASVDQNPD